jgi:hypothetical protein
MNGRHSIGKERAIALYNSGFWKDLSDEEIFRFQFFLEELCMPFGVFHGAAETTLGRSVWTHEFAFWDTLRAEYMGEKSAPTMEEIVGLLPADKVILVQA